MNGYSCLKCSFVVSNHNILISSILFVAFKGSMAPYHFTQPSIDGYVQAVSPTATEALVTCSLNVTISSNMFILWRHNSSLVSITPPNEVTRTGNTATLQIGNFQPSDVGVYQCILNNFTNGWILRRNIILGKCAFSVLLKC